MTENIKKSRKKTIINVGDIISISQSNGQYTLACVLGFWPNLKTVMAISLLEKEFSSVDLENNSLFLIVAQEIKKRNFMSILATPNNKAKWSEWPKLGSIDDLNLEELLPSIPFATGSMVGGAFEDNLLVEAFIKAYRGLVGWEEPLPGRPGYLKSLLYTKFWELLT